MKDEMELTWTGAGNRVPRGKTASAKALRQKRSWHILGLGSRSTGNGEDSGKRGVQRDRQEPDATGLCKPWILS